MRESIFHIEGPFAGLKPGDVISIVYHGAPTSLMRVTKVRNYSLEGLDGEFKCRVTIVTPTELRFYGELGPNRETVLRGIRIEKVTQP
jgi:hypothetical protein